MKITIPPKRGNFVKSSFCALLLALLLTVTGALADVDTSAAPVLTLTVPGTQIVAGSTTMLTLNATLPGFMNLRVLDSSGNAVLTFKNYELHSNVNTMTLLTRNKDGSLLPAGTYTIEASMSSQFGVASNTVTGTLTLFDAPVMSTVPNTSTAPSTGWQVPDAEDGDAYESDDAEDESYENDSYEDDSYEDNSYEDNSYEDNSYEDNSYIEPDTSINNGFDAEPYVDPNQTPDTFEQPASTPVFTPVAGEGVNYTSGNAMVGQEGLQIGVGVSDYAQQEDAGYWGLTANASDAEIWAALTRTMTRVDVPEKEFAYIYDSTGEGRKRIATISGLSQGVNLISKSGGWALVEAYRDEDGAFVRGYIRSNTLTTVKPNSTYGIVIDKATQMLYVYRNGERVGSCQVCTGLAVGDHLNRETPAGEFITMTRRGTIEYVNEYHKCLYTIRICGNYHLCEIPFSTDNKSDYSLMSDKLGQKASRGNICIAHDASVDGGINASWIWDMTDTNRRVKVLIFDDKDRSQVPVGQ